MKSKLPMFWRQILEKELLKKQGRTQEKLALSDITPFSLALSNITIPDIVEMIESILD